MEEILKQIEENGLSIELWNSIDNPNIKLNIIANHDISNIYWYLVKNDEDILKQGKKEYKEKLRLEAHKKILDDFLNGPTKRIDISRNAQIILDIYQEEEEYVQYIKDLILADKTVIVNETFLEDRYREIIDFKIENGKKIEANDFIYLLGHIGSEDIDFDEYINKCLDNGINMSVGDLKNITRMGMSTDPEYKRKLLQNLIDNNDSDSFLLASNDHDNIIDFQIIEENIKQGKNVHSTIIFSGNFNNEQRASLIKLKVENNLPIDTDEYYWSHEVGDIENKLEFTKYYIKTGGKITKRVLEKLKKINEQEVNNILLEFPQNIADLEDALSNVSGTGLEYHKIMSDIVKGYFENNTNIKPEEFDDEYFFMETLEPNEKLDIMKKYIRNNKNNSIYVDSVLDFLDTDEQKEELIKECLNLDISIDQDILIQRDISSDLIYEITMKYIDPDEKNIKFTEELLQKLNPQQIKNIKQKYIDSNRVLTDNFLNIFDSDEERKQVIFKYLEGKQDVSLYNIEETLLKLNPPADRIEIIKACLINDYRMVGIDNELIKYLNSFEDDNDKLKLLEIATQYNQGVGRMEFTAFADINIRRQAYSNYFQIKEKGKVQLVLDEFGDHYIEYESDKDNICQEIDQIMSKISKNIQSKENIEYKNILEKRFYYLNKEICNLYNEKLGSGYLNIINQLEHDTLFKKIKQWDKKNIIPEQIIFEKVSLDKIDEFDYKIWNNLVKSVNKDLKDEEKGALVEIAYVFGLFNKDLKIARGIAKTDDEMTDEEKMQKSAWENYEARRTKIVEFVNSLETVDALHEMFDGMKMKFNPKFYHFFFLNKEQIKKNVDLAEGLDIQEGIYMGSIQKELKNIYENIDEIQQFYNSGTPTIDQARMYILQKRKNILNQKYQNIDEGNNELARLCALSGCNQSRFEEYQEVFNKSKNRGYSSIPRIKATKKIEKIDLIDDNEISVEKNIRGNDKLIVTYENKKISFEILKMDNPRAIVCGEKIFSDCCQRIGGAGESCLKHSQESKNGGILEIKTEDGTFLGQSWCWVNGNVLCFDSAELKGLDENKNMTNKEKEEYLSMIKIGYEQMAKRMLEESNKKVEEYVKSKKAQARMEYGEDSIEYKQKEQEIETKGENIKIKQVTIGEGYWDISLKLSSIYKNEGKKIKGKRENNTLANPIEPVKYIKDSNIQYELARIDGIEDKDIKYELQEEQQEQLFTDKRMVIKQQGEINRDVITKIKQIEKSAHKENMQMMQDMDVTYDVDPSKDLARMYGVKKDDLKVICGEDWYYVYSEHDDNIVIHDAARTPEARIEGEENISGTEVVEAFYDIMDESFKSGKPLKAQLREDTSYALYLKMLRKGQLEQIGEENVYDFNTGMHVEYSQQQQELLEERLKNIEERKKLADEENTVMHEIICTVTPKGKKMIDRIKSKDDERE